MDNLTPQKTKRYDLVDFKTEVVPLTLMLAKHYDRMPTLDGERDPESKKGMRRVASLYNALTEGRFHSPTWSDVIITDEGGKKFRVNGGHSSHMLTLAGKANFPSDLMVSLQHFRVKTMADAIALYQQFDYRLGARSEIDVNGPICASVPILKGIPTALVTRAAKGVCCHLRLHNPNKKFDHKDYILLEPEFIKWATNYCGDKIFRKMPVIAIMCATWSHDREAAERFWSLVCDEETVKTQPVRVLHLFLVALAVAGGKESKFSTHKIYTKISHAWNAWRGDDRPTTMPYFTGRPLPKLV